MPSSPILQACSNTTSPQCVRCGLNCTPGRDSAQAALRNRNSSFVLDGEAVLLGVDGRSDFDALHSRRHDAEVEFYAFDILVSDGEDLHGLPLPMRKASLSQLLARRVDGIFLSDFEQGEIGPDLFRHACLMEGMVSKHRESLYRGGRFRAGSRSKTGRIRRSAGCRISSETAPARAHATL
jgi:ATP-dependent DNA ligase